MPIQVLAWSFGTNVMKFRYRPYWHFNFALLKTFKGLRLGVITPLFGIFICLGWPYRYPGQCRFLLNWKKVPQLKDGGLLFEKHWMVA